MHFSNIDKAYKGLDMWSRWNFENVFTYAKTFDVHNLTIIAGTTAFKDMHENLWGTKNDLIFDDFEHSYLDNATDPESANAGGGYSDHTVSSLFARLNYDLKNRYMLTATIRRTDPRGLEAKTNMDTSLCLNRMGYLKGRFHE